MCAKSHILIRRIRIGGQDGVDAPFFFFSSCELRGGGRSTRNNLSTELTSSNDLRQNRTLFALVCKLAHD